MVKSFGLYGTPLSCTVKRHKMHDTLLLLYIKTSHTETSCCTVGERHGEVSHCRAVTKKNSKTHVHDVPAGPFLPGEVHQLVVRALEQADGPLS